MKEILEKFKEKKIAVIGDIILDKYIYGKVDRISPEAPVPIVKVINEKYTLGGAANVAANISTLGGKAYLLGISGNDHFKTIFIDKAREFGIDTNGVLTDPKKNMIRKTRVIGLNQQLLRIDHENTDYIETHLKDKFLQKLRDINDLSAIIVSDYAKGTITEKLIEQLKHLSWEKNIFLIVDPKPKHKNWYEGSSLITPNKKEAQEMSGVSIDNEDDFYKAGKYLFNKFDADVIITAGADGMYVFEELTPQPPLSNKEGEIKKDESPNDVTSNSTLKTHNLSVSHIPTVAKEVYDVSGAGDTVVATLALALSCNATLNDAAILANHAAGIKVGKIGTAPIFLEELVKEVKQTSCLL